MVKPEGGNSTITNEDSSNGSISTEIIIDNAPEETMIVVMVFKRGSVVEKPGLPTNILVREDLVDKLHEQALVL
jgi:hypothetical protein